MATVQPTSTQPATTYPMTRGCPLDPPAEYRDLQAQGEPIRRVRLDFDGSDVWLVTRYDDAKAVLSDPRFSSDFQTPGFPARLTSQPPGPGTFIRMDPPDHSRLRKLMVSELGRKQVAALRPVIERTVDDLLKAMVDAGPPADLIEDYALPLPSIVITEMLGVPYDDREFFHHTTKVMGDQNTSPQERLEVRNNLKSYLDRLVADKEAAPREDLLSRLTQRREQAGVSRDEVVGIATLLMVAGYETVANQIGVGTLALLQHPGLPQRLAADPALVPQAVEEVVRHQTVIDYGARRAVTDDVEIGGRLMRKGDGVVVVLAAANRDEAVFAGSGDLSIEREAAAEHLSFGWGMHQCVGQTLARAQLTATWERMFRAIPTLRLAVPLEEVPFRFDMFVYGVHALPIEW